MKKKRKHGRIDFGMRRISVPGIVSTCLVGVEALIFLTGVYLSYLKQGEAGMRIAVFAFAVLVLASTGLVLGICGLTHRDCPHGPDWFGTIANGTVLAGICTLFVFGVMS